MNRTPEQVAADDAVAAAIEQALVAYEIVDPGDMVNDYLIIAAYESIDRPGFVGYSTLHAGGASSHHACLGLAHVAVNRFAGYAADDEAGG